MEEVVISLRHRFSRYLPLHIYALDQLLHAVLFKARIRLTHKTNSRKSNHRVTRIELRGTVDIMHFYALDQLLFEINELSHNSTYETSTYAGITIANFREKIPWCEIEFECMKGGTP